MALTAPQLQGQIDALVTAIGSGVMSVSYEGKSVSYSSFDEMTKRVAFLRRELARLTGGVPSVVTSNFDRGYQRRTNGW